MPRWTLSHLKYTAKAFSAALVTSCIAVVEVRDMSERAQWDKGVGFGTYDTGDIVIVSNRWFALPPKHAFYSFMSKLVMKTTWDDVGVVVTRNGVPHILIVEYDSVTFEPLQQFVDTRQPRAVAVRKLMSLQPDPAAPAVAAEFVTEAKDRTTRPWSALTHGAWNLVRDREHFRWAVEASSQAWKVRTMMGTSLPAAIERELLHQTILMEEEKRRKLHKPPRRPTDKVNNASLVAELFQAMKLLPEPAPAAFKYAVTDYAWSLPLINAKLAEPLIVCST
jgi:hypothetical protein